MIYRALIPNGSDYLSFYPDYILKTLKAKNPGSNFQQWYNIAVFIYDISF